MKAILLLITIGLLAALSTASEPMLQYNITRTWNNQTVDANQTISLTFSSDKNGLVIDILSPFSDEKLPSAKVGRFDRLTDFNRVVVLFLSSATINYLELQFGSGSHYLAYDLMGWHQVRNKNLLLNYTASINMEENNWTGRAVVPTDYFPPGVDSFSASAIHFNDDGSKHKMSLFPVDSSAKEPDMEDPGLFKPIDLSKFIQIKKVLPLEIVNENAGNQFSAPILINILALGLCFSLAHIAW